MSEENGRNGLESTNDANDDYQHQFHILDEVTNDSDGNNSIYSDSDIPDDEIDKLLEDALKNKNKRNAEEAGLGKLLFIIHSNF